MMKTGQLFESNFAMTLLPGAADDVRELERSGYWTGWTRRHWPAEALRPGRMFYGFDTRERALRVLLRVTRGGAFAYRTKPEFASKVEKITGSRPGPDFAHWKNIPNASPGRFNTGIAIRWRVVRPVRIPLEVRFPQLGWLRLDPNVPVVGDFDPAEQFLEGGRRVQKHMRTERNPLLRTRARDLWRHRLGRLRCMACDFDFERVYGDIGGDFIEMHHDVPLSVLTRRSPVTPEQLKPLCANCHRMVHREECMLTIRRLKLLIARRHA